MPAMKRPGDEKEPTAEGDDFASFAKRAKLEGRTFSADEVGQLVEEEVRKALAQRSTSPKPEWLRETFTPNDPVHGLIHLPAIVKAIVDTRVFQRMRHIKQLGVCSLVYPGATHNRFFHSIGTAYLAYDFVKGLQMRQPELMVTSRDVLCVTLAGLCHDLGHPCFSHMFEVFVHTLGREKRLDAEAVAKRESRPIDSETERSIQKFENWSHEDASVSLLEIVFTEKDQVLREAGLCSDAQGDDFACIRELIDPPKKELEELLGRGELREGWSKHIKGRPVEKAWLYEVVSNWRSGIDVDKFDYFRRDALHLGIHKQFDHNRYMKAVCVLLDSSGVPTVSPPDKEKDSLRENMMELRKSLHRSAYQHKTVKKIEMHMIDIMKMMDKHIEITGTGGKKFSMSQAAVQMDPVAYQKLTDQFIETRLEENEIKELGPAVEEYDRRIIHRNLMRLVADWDVERDMSGVVPLDGAVIIDGVLEAYETYAPCLQPDQVVQPVSREELKSEVCSFHYGMKFKDPMSRVLFHGSKDTELKSHMSDVDARPMRQKVFCFWNPVSKPSETVHKLTLSRLTLAFSKWANQQVERKNDTTTDKLMSPNRLSRGAEETENKPPGASKPRRSLKINASCPPDMAEEKAAIPPQPSPQPTKPKRSLRINSSCPLDPADFFP